MRNLQEQAKKHSVTKNYSSEVLLFQKKKWEQVFEKAKIYRLYLRWNKYAMLKLAGFAQELKLF